MNDEQMWEQDQLNQSDEIDWDNLWRDPDFLIDTIRDMAYEIETLKDRLDTCKRNAMSARNANEPVDTSLMTDPEYLNYRHIQYYLDTIINI